MKINKKIILFTIATLVVLSLAGLAMAKEKFSFESKERSLQYIDEDIQKMIEACVNTDEQTMEEMMLYMHSDEGYRWMDKFHRGEDLDKLSNWMNRFHSEEQVETMIEACH